MPGIKELKTRIKSIQGMRKITRAMQMVSAAKMRKAQTAVLSSRTYADLAWELVGSLTTDNKLLPTSSLEKEEEVIVDPLFSKEGAGGALKLLGQYPNAKKVGVVLLTTNTGLVGSLNSNLIFRLREVSPNNSQETIAEIITYGKKAKVLATRMQKNIVADFNKQDKTISTEDIFPLAKFITDAYLTGQYRKIVIVYNHFVSTAVQKASVKQLLPFSSGVIASSSAAGGAAILSKEKKIAYTSADASADRSDALAMTDYLFEPTPAQVLEHLLPRIIESQLYETILESNASEHSARMIMMKNATDAAGDLVSDLTLTYNGLRQNKITTELAEITAGRIALE